MIRFLPALLALTLFSAVAVADEHIQPPSNLVSIAVGGGAGVSASYHRALLRSDALSVEANLGFGYHIVGYSVPHGLALLYGRRHVAEIGAIGTYAVSEIREGGILGPSSTGRYEIYKVVPLVGYRLVSNSGRIVFRLFFSPILSNDEAFLKNDNSEEWSLFPWGGLALAFGF